MTDITNAQAQPVAASPYFRLPDLHVCSVRYPTTGGWIVWNWDRTTWDHRSDAERDDIKAAEKLLFENGTANA